MSSSIFKKNNDPVIVVNKDFQKCYLFISFPIKKEDIPKLRVLKSLNLDKSITYDTDKKVYEAKVNNYCLSLDKKISNIGNNYFFEVLVSFPSPASLGKDVLEDNLKFVREVIYHPYTVDGVFPSREVEDTINIIKDQISCDFKDVLWYYYYRNVKTFDENNYLSGILADNPNLLNSVTPSNLYEYYQKIISFSPIIFLIGNVDPLTSSQKIKDILLENREEVITFEKKYTSYCQELPDKVLEVTETSTFKSSGICYNYKVKNMSCQRDADLLALIADLLDSNKSRLLFDTLRLENDLMYRGSVKISTSFGSLSLWSLTGKKNIDKVKEKIEEIMKKVTSTDFIASKLSGILDDAKLNHELIKEDLYDIMYDHVDKYIEYKDKAFYERVQDVTPEEIKNFITNRLVLASIYVGVGEDNE